jgi:hypothetical protein
MGLGDLRRSWKRYVKRRSGWVEGFLVFVVVVVCRKRRVREF